MKRAKYLFVFFIGTLVYVTLSLCFGQNSIRCFNNLEEQKRVISNQVAELQNINSELSLEVNALKYDKAVIAAYARKLDYVSDGEKLIKINGLQKSQPQLYNAGSVVKHSDSTFMSEVTCKAIALLVSFLTLMVIFFYDLSKGNVCFGKKEKNIITEIPLYDLQQI